MIANFLATESQLMESHLTESRTDIRKWLNPYQITRIEGFSSWDSVSRDLVARDSVMLWTNYHNCKIDYLSFGIVFIFWDQIFWNSKGTKMLRKKFKLALTKVQKLHNSIKVDKTMTQNHLLSWSFVDFYKLSFNFINIHVVP